MQSKCPYPSFMSTLRFLARRMEDGNDVRSLTNDERAMLDNSEELDRNDSDALGRSPDSCRMFGSLLVRFDKAGEPFVANAALHCAFQWYRFNTSPMSWTKFSDLIPAWIRQDARPNDRMSGMIHFLESLDAKPGMLDEFWNYMVEAYPVLEREVVRRRIEQESDLGFRVDVLMSAANTLASFSTQAIEFAKTKNPDAMNRSSWHRRAPETLLEWRRCSGDLLIDVERCLNERRAPASIAPKLQVIADQIRVMQSAVGGPKLEQAWLHTPDCYAELSEGISVLVNLRPLVPEGFSLNEASPVMAGRPAAIQPPAATPGADLLLFLREKSQYRSPLADVPEHLLNADVLTVMDADRLIEFGHRTHIWVGGQLKVEPGWDFVSVTGPNKKPMSEFIAEALDCDGDERIRPYVQLTANGRVAASRLVLTRSEEAIQTRERPISTDGCAFSTICDQEAKRRGNGTKAWEIARERGEEYIRDHPFPGLNELARRSGCSPHTLRSAIQNSESLTRARATHELGRAKAMPRRRSFDEPARRAMADEALRKLIEHAPESQRAELNGPDFRQQLVKMEPAALAAMVEDAEKQAKRRSKATVRARARTQAG